MPVIERKEQCIHLYRALPLGGIGFELDATEMDLGGATSAGRGPAKLELRRPAGTLSSRCEARAVDGCIGPDLLVSSVSSVARSFTYGIS